MGKQLRHSHSARTGREIEVGLGDELIAGMSDDGSMRIARKRTREEAIEDLKQFEGWLPSDVKFDREEAKAR